MIGDVHETLKHRDHFVQMVFLLTQTISTSVGDHANMISICELINRQLLQYRVVELSLAELII